MPKSDDPPAEIESVERWRKQVLTEAGYPEEEAFVLAKRPDVDLHRAIGLLEAGCPVKTALKILL